MENPETDDPESGFEMEDQSEYPDFVFTEDPERIEEQPPTYNETISKIREQLPKLKLSYSISVSAQRVGRHLSVKRSGRQKVDVTQSLPATVNYQI